jgi:hypothetical protein
MSSLPIVPQNRKLQIEDFICRRCHMEATVGVGETCQLCRALGKMSEPVVKTTFWEDIQFGIRFAKKYISNIKN